MHLIIQADEPFRRILKKAVKDVVKVISPTSIRHVALLDDYYYTSSPQPEKVEKDEPKEDGEGTVKSLMPA